MANIKGYNQFINESLLQSPEMKEFRMKHSDKLADFIRLHCSKFVNDMKPSGKMLYRGVESMKNVDMLEIITVRKDRKSIDTPDFINSGIDDRLEKRFGVRPRTQGAFATSDYKVASSYGHDDNKKAYLFFPIGDYKFIWSEYIFDLWDSTRYLANDDEKTREEVLDYIGNESYKNDDFKSAVESGNEIMFVCDQYIIVDKSYEDALIKRLFY